MLDPAQISVFRSGNLKGGSHKKRLHAAVYRNIYLHFSILHEQSVIFFNVSSPEKALLFTNTARRGTGPFSKCTAKIRRVAIA